MLNQILASIPKQFDFQIPAVRDHHKAYSNGDMHRLEGSDMGVGKTYIALNTAKALGMIPFIVCPKNSKKIWATAAKLIDIDTLAIVNYEKLIRGNTNWGTFETWNKKMIEYGGREADYLAATEKQRESMVKPKKPMRLIEDGDYDFHWTNIPANVFVIFDEAHRMKGETSLTAELLVGAVKFASAKSKMKTMAVTATSACGPNDMRALGYALGMHSLVDFHRWAKMHGCIDTRWGKLEFCGDPSCLTELHEEIFPKKGCRITVAELGNRFPETQIEAEAYDMDEQTGALNKVYKEMQDELLRWELTKDTSRHPLTIILRARQKAELLKVPTYVEMARDAIDDGMSVLIFVNFTESLLALGKKFKTDQLYYGGNKRDRDLVLNLFQENKKRILLLNIAAGAESINCHDTSKGGKFPRYSIISPSWSALKMHQACGRPHRAGGTSKSIQRLVFAAGTIEQKVCDRVRTKLKNMSTLNDGDLIPEHMKDLLYPYLAQVNAADAID